jgi:hypothetical protein
METTHYLSYSNQIESEKTLSALADNNTRIANGYYYWVM